VVVRRARPIHSSTLNRTGARRAKLSVETSTCPSAHPSTYLPKRFASLHAVNPSPLPPPCIPAGLSAPPSEREALAHPLLPASRRPGATQRPRPHHSRPSRPSPCSALTEPMPALWYACPPAPEFITLLYARRFDSIDTKCKELTYAAFFLGGLLYSTLRLPNPMP
jgi:hypothetical protein